MDKIRRHIIFYGRVQGVGFRWNCKTFANAIGLSGWVQNLLDGSVEVEVQGTEEKICNLISYLKESPYIEIDSIETKKIEPIRNESYFYAKDY